MVMPKFDGGVGGEWTFGDGLTAPFEFAQKRTPSQSSRFPHKVIKWASQTSTLGLKRGRYSNDESARVG